MRINVFPFRERKIKGEVVVGCSFYWQEKFKERKNNNFPSMIKDNFVVSCTTVLQKHLYLMCLAFI